MLKERYRNHYPFFHEAFVTLYKGNRGVSRAVMLNDNSNRQYEILDKGIKVTEGLVDL